MTNTKQTIEIGLMLGGAALSVAGALFIEPVVIGVGVLAAGTVAVMRYKDQRSAIQAAKKLASVNTLYSQ